MIITSISLDMFGCVWCVMVCVCLEAATKKSCCTKACIVTILCQCPCTDMYNLLIVPSLTSLKRLAFLCVGCELVTVRALNGMKAMKNPFSEKKWKAWHSNSCQHL